MNETRKNEKGMINGALTLTVSVITVKLLGLLYKIPLSYILTDEGMGYFNTAYTVFSLFYIICTTGIPKAISILVSEAEGKGDTQKATEIYTTAFKMFFFFGLLISVIFLILAAPISIFIGNRGSYYSMAIIAPSILFVCASGIIRGYFNGQLKFLPIAVSEIISGATKLILGLALAYLAKWLGYDFELISAFTILGTTLGSFLGFIYLYFKKRSFSDVNIKQKYAFSPKLARKIFRIAIPLTATAAIGSVSNIIDLTIIMNRLRASGHTELQSAILYGNYTTLAIPMLNLIATLIGPLSAVLLPIVSKKKLLPEAKAAGGEISLAFKLTLFICMPISILFTFKSCEILSLLFENTSAVLAAPFLSLIAPGIVFMALLTISNSVLEGMGNTKAPMMSLVFASLVKIIVSYILIGRSEFGLLGASLGTTLSYFVGMCISLYSLTVSHKIRPKMLKDLLIFLFSSILAYIISDCIIRLIGISGRVAVLIEISVFGAIYVISLILIELSRLNIHSFMLKMYKK